MSKKKQNIIPIELSQEDIRFIKLQQEQMEELMDMIIQASKIPSRYFGSDNNE